VQRVDPVVPLAHRARPVGVATDEVVERVGQHLACQARHLLDLRKLRERRLFRQVLDGLRDVYRVIAHPLEVVGDLHRHRDQPQVARERLLQREQVDAGVIDLHLQRIELPVGQDHRIRLRRVALAQRLHRRAHLLLGEGRHLQEQVLQLRQLLVEMASSGDGAHPNLPVMYASVCSSFGLVKMSFVRPSSTSRPM
jgi:hypothetical protein